jgi:PST family polysaccharide transporter
MSNSYKEIVKTTGVVGAVQVIKLFFGLLRNKLIALYLGASGLGVWGLYLGFTEMIQGLSSLGLEKSGVKQIAENHLDAKKRNLTIQVVKLSVLSFSILCSSIAAIFSSYFSESIFGSLEYKNGILICCVVICINSLFSAYKSILNGLREIKKLAYSQLLGVLIGNIIVFALVPFFDESLIPIYFLIIAISSLVPSFIFVKSLNLSFSKMSFKEFVESLSTLMKVGMAFWFSAVFMALMTYLTKIFLKEELSVSIVGVYQASWTISNLYIGIILSSMGVDFFPKICRVITDKVKVNTMLNEQIEFGLLISIPFIIGIFIFAPYLLTLLYSSEFVEGASIIRWQLLGVITRLLGFPFGYALMAKGKVKKYMIAQFLFSGLNYVLLVLLVLNIGYVALGFNYFIAYFIYVGLICWFCYQEFKYSFSRLLIKLLTFIILSLIISSLIIAFTEGVLYFVFGVLLCSITLYYSFVELNKNLNINMIDFLKKKINKKK